MGPYIYDDDPSISGGCVHTMNLRLPDDPFAFGWLRRYHGSLHMALSIRMAPSIPWIHVLIYMIEISDMYVHP